MKHREEMYRIYGRNITKFIGALTVEVLRENLVKEGLGVSDRDVFIKGVPNEIDLMILKNKEKPEHRLIYNPSQVAAVLEIKFSGIFNKEEIPRIQEFFSSVRKVNENIKCIYLVVSENTNFKYFPEEKKLGDYSFLLFERETSNLEEEFENGEIKATNDWSKLLKLFD